MFLSTLLYRCFAWKRKIWAYYVWLGCSNDFEIEVRVAFSTTHFRVGYHQHSMMLDEDPSFLIYNYNLEFLQVLLCNCSLSASKFLLTFRIRLECWKIPPTLQYSSSHWPSVHIRIKSAEIELLGESAFVSSSNPENLIYMWVPILRTKVILCPTSCQQYFSLGIYSRIVSNCTS